MENFSMPGGNNRIGSLGKLGRFEPTAGYSFVYIASNSLASGLILSITSWYNKVLHVLDHLRNKVHLITLTYYFYVTQP